MDDDLEIKVTFWWLIKHTDIEKREKIPRLYTK